MMHQLTVHLGVGLPLVVPAPEGLAVVLGALLSPEVHGAERARPSVAQLVETAGAGAEFTVVLGPGWKKEVRCADFNGVEFSQVYM